MGLAYRVISTIINTRGGEGERQMLLLSFFLLVGYWLGVGMLTLGLLGGCGKAKLT